MAFASYSTECSRSNIGTPSYITCVINYQLSQLLSILFVHPLLSVWVDYMLCIHKDPDSLLTNKFLKLVQLGMVYGHKTWVHPSKWGKLYETVRCIWKKTFPTFVVKQVQDMPKPFPPDYRPEIKGRYVSWLSVSPHFILLWDNCLPYWNLWNTSGACIRLCWHLPKDQLCCTWP